MNAIFDFPSLPDRQLVELHLAGEPGAFRQIVERHQSMVCALAVSACGDVARSEDVAQEVFLAAWKQLPQLREPDKLRPWLGGIARNLIRNSFRSQQRVPTARAEPLSPETPAIADGPREQAITADETSLMWSVLGSIPEIYREPMVLYYREHHSVPAVAAALDISEDSVRQRLTRGRALLTERMAKRVEQVLERSAPTPAFAGMVLLTLPLGAGPIVVESVAGAVSAGGGSAGAVVKTVSVAGGGAAAAVAKGGLALKMLSAVVVLPALMGGITEYLRFRAQYEAPSRVDRRQIVLTHMWPLFVNATLLGGIAFAIWVPVPLAWKPVALIPFVAALVMTARFDYKKRQAAAATGAGKSVGPAFEYRSRGGWLGLPWIHVRSGGHWRTQKAAGWIAVSDGLAIGGFFASGPVAVAPIAVGGLTAGLLATGGLAIGFASMGVVAVGGWAAGGMAVASYAAQGWVALAGEFVQGGLAHAAHVNDLAAKEYFQGNLFFRFAQAGWRLALGAAFFGWLPPLVLMAWHLRKGGHERGAGSGVRGAESECGDAPL